MAVSDFRCHLMPSQSWADQFAQASIALYDSLPKHGKPTVRSNGVPEWTILAVISLVIQEGDDAPSKIVPISLGTGAKCLPANKLPPLGDTLHDCHAEVLGRRGFVRWLLEEGRRVAAGDDHLGVLELQEGQFRLKAGVQVWMYVSALPVSPGHLVRLVFYSATSVVMLQRCIPQYTNLQTWLLSKTVPGRRPSGRRQTTSLKASPLVQGL